MNYAGFSWGLSSRHTLKYDKVLAWKSCVDQKLFFISFLFYCWWSTLKMRNRMIDIHKNTNDDCYNLAIMAILVIMHFFFWKLQVFNFQIFWFGNFVILQLWGNAIWQNYIIAERVKSCIAVKLLGFLSGKINTL